MKKLVSLLLIFLSFGHAKVESSGPDIILPPDFHIAAYGNSASYRYSHFKDSANVFFIDENNIQNLPAGSALDILNEISDYIAPFPNDNIVLITDGVQSLFTAGVTEILNAFLKLDAEFVISPTRCRPSVTADMSVVNSYPTDKDTLSFLDSRSFMGRVDSMKKIINRLIVIAAANPTFDLDQVFNLDFSKHRKAYTIDTHASLFLSLCGICPVNNDIYISCPDIGEDILLPTPFIQVNLSEAHGNPKIIHGNGEANAGDFLLDDIWRFCLSSG